jgi:hypothetical protein
VHKFKKNAEGRVLKLSNKKRDARAEIANNLSENGYSKTVSKAVIQWYKPVKKTKAD